MHLPILSTHLAQGMRLNDFRNFLQHEKRYSEHTVTSYLTDVGQFGKYLADEYATTDVNEVSHMHVRSWMVSLLDKGIVPRSVNRKLSALRTFFRFMRRQGIIEHNPFDRVTGPKSSSRLPTVIGQNEMDMLLRGMSLQKTFSGMRDCLILELLYTAGMRRSELIRLHVSDVDFQRSTLHLLGKGKKERIVPFGDSLGQALKTYLKLRHEEFGENNGPLLLTDKGKAMYPKFVYRTVRKYLGAVTTSDQRSPHTLRHAFATHLTDEGADINAVKELLGHSSLAATQVYTHTSMKRLKSLYDQAHPKAKKTT